MSFSKRLSKTQIAAALLEHHNWPDLCLFTLILMLSFSVFLCFLVFLFSQLRWFYSYLCFFNSTVTLQYFLSKFYSILFATDHFFPSISLCCRIHLPPAVPETCFSRFYSPDLFQVFCFPLWHVVLV